MRAAQLLALMLEDATHSNLRAIRTYTGLDGWMDPDGKLHRSPTRSHAKWAAKKLGHDPANVTDDQCAGFMDTLYQRGWVRIVYERCFTVQRSVKTIYVSHGDEPPNKLQLAQLERMAIELGAALIAEGPWHQRTIYTPPE